MGSAASCMGSKHAEITAGDVEVAQEAWAKGIVDIGKVYQEKGDYKAEAEKVITDLYGSKEPGMEVLFKPTKASEKAICHDYDGAVSYFVGAAAAGDIGLAEDKGFAINPWTAVRFENSKTILNADSATAMGEYFLTTLKGDVAKVEYTFQYQRGADGALKIVVHHSSLPYSP